MASAICRCSTPRSDCLYSSSQPSPSHFKPSKIEWTEASVLRSTSVSSSRKIIVPRFRWAYNQLKIKVRALPTWRNPVGDGAKRTRGVACEDELRESRSAKLRWYGPSEDIVKRPSRAFPHALSLFEASREPDHVLKSCCFRTPGVKP